MTFGSRCSIAVPRNTPPAKQFNNPISLEYLVKSTIPCNVSCNPLFFNIYINNISKCITRKQHQQYCKRYCNQHVHISSDSQGALKAQASCRRIRLLEGTQPAGREQ